MNNNDITVYNSTAESLLLKQNYDLGQDMDIVKNFGYYLLSFRPIKIIFNILYYFILIIFGWPIWIIFRHSPSLWGFGGWGGRDNPYICSYYTSTKTSQWTKHPIFEKECERLILEQFQSYMIFVAGIFYFVFLLHLYLWCYQNFNMFNWAYFFIKLCLNKTKKKLTPKKYYSSVQIEEIPISSNQQLALNPHNKNNTPSSAEKKNWLRCLNQVSDENLNPKYFESSPTKYRQSVLNKKNL